MIIFTRMEKKSKHEQALRKVKSSIDKIRKDKEISSWFNAFSNNILPPVFFLFIAIVTLYYIPQVGNSLLRVNLSIISLAATTLSLYILILMF